MRVVRKVLMLICVSTLVTLVAVGTQFFSPSSAYAGNKKIQLNVKGMKGYASITKVKEALTGVKGVKKAYVDFRNERAIVTVKKGTNPSALIRAIKKAGFKAYVAEKVEVGAKRREKEAYGDDWDMDTTGDTDHSH
ncbi:MAG: heavy metal-associated domain-containing protein [Candidatus Brocadiales bacterium]